MHKLEGKLNGWARLRCKGEHSHSTPAQKYTELHGDAEFGVCCATPNSASHDAATPNSARDALICGAKFGTGFHYATPNSECDAEFKHATPNE